MVMQQTAGVGMLQHQPGYGPGLMFPGLHAFPPMEPMLTGTSQAPLPPGSQNGGPSVIQGGWNPAPPAAHGGSQIPPIPTDPRTMMLRSQVPSCIGKRPRVVDTPTFVAARALLDEWPAAELDKTRNIKAAQDFKVGVCVRILAPELLLLQLLWQW